MSGRCVLGLGLVIGLAACAPSDTEAPATTPAAEMVREVMTEAMQQALTPDEVFAQPCEYLGVHFSGRSDRRYKVGENPAELRFGHCNGRGPARRRRRRLRSGDGHLE